MLLKWKRTPQGDYESNAIYVDAVTGNNKPLYIIRRVYHLKSVKNAWDFIERGRGRFLIFHTLNKAKRHAQEIENRNPEVVTINRCSGEFEEWCEAGGLKSTTTY